MIAEIFKPFQEVELTHKITYHLDKIESGVARELFNSCGDTLLDMPNTMQLIASMNDRVKFPYIEFVLSSPVGEELTDAKFIQIANEYMKEMGYSESCYSIIKHDDKDNKHVHVLATTIDFNGLRINDSMSKIHSGNVMRKLEKEHGIEVMEKGKSINSKSLGESQYRQYFFDKALHKALRSHNANERVSKLLMQSDTYKLMGQELSKQYTNTEWKVMLGDDIYSKLLEVLSDSKFFNPLFKDELLDVMDRLYPICKNVGEFRDKMQNENYYMRLVSDKGKSCYVYGIPERSFYVKDKALPEKYRYGKISFDGHQMAPDEQKHFLYINIFHVLNASSNYDDFKTRVAETGIKIVEHTNKSGVYGLSFSVCNIDKSEVFKSSDISKRLTYNNIQLYFQKESLQEVPVPEDKDTSKQDLQKVLAPDGRDTSKQDLQEESKSKELNTVMNTPIDPVIVCYINTRKEWERELAYMSPGSSMMFSSIPLDMGSEKRHSKQEDELPLKKKKKRKNKGLSI